MLQSAEMSSQQTTDLSWNTILKAQTTWRDDPIGCSRYYFGSTLWSRQQEVLEAIRDYKRVVVRSGNTIGKSRIAAEVVLIYLLSHYPSMVITTAPTFSQVEDVLWKEIASLYYKSKVPIGGSLLQTELNFNSKWFARGISTDKMQRFQGRHSPHLLVLIDEASGVEDEIWDSIEALHPEKILALGNPLFDFGRFYKAFHHQQWHKISISCRECVQWQKQHVKIDGLVTDEWIKEQEEFHGPKSDYVSIHVDGEFPEQSESSIISRAWVERARKGLDANNAPLPVESQEDSVRILACDVATKHGTNATVIAYRYGHTFLEMAGYFRIPITQTRDKLLFRFNRYTYSDVLPKIVLDSDGIGEGLGDMLDSESVPNIQFHGGTNQAAMDQGKFHNLRTQLYLLVAKKFERGLYNLSKLDEKSYEILKNQLCSIRAKHPDNLGRLQLETKEEMMARNIESPDYADSFMMSEYAYFVSNMADVQPFSYR